MTLLWYVVRLSNEGATSTLATQADTAREAVTAVTDAEIVPRTAVRWVRRQPVCDWCTEPGTRYDRNSGTETPLCKAHAKHEYPDASDRNICTGVLGVCRYELVDAVEWEAPTLVTTKGNPDDD